MHAKSETKVLATLVATISLVSFGTVESESQANPKYEMHTEEEFCYADPKHPFYQRDTDGAVCCRGQELPVITVAPEVKGDCAISTKTGKDGILDSKQLWCAYTCSLKKKGLIDTQGKIVPQKFLDHLTQGLSPATAKRLRTIMEKYLKCFKPMKNADSPCHTPLSFHKCYQDALVFLCTLGGLPKNNDFSGYPAVKGEYEKMKHFCYFNNKKAMPGCCHGKPIPWTVAEILESARDDTRYNKCIKEMGDDCDATCLLRSLDVLNGWYQKGEPEVVNDDLDLDVNAFSKKILKHFPLVKASAWMDYTGPVFLFYDEVLVDMGDVASTTTHKVCRFHDRILELHESKVDQYCNMEEKEVKELMKAT